MINFPFQITKCAIEKSCADAKVRRSTCSASSAMTQYSGTSAAGSVHQVLLEPGGVSPGPPAPASPGPGSHHGTINRNYACAVSPQVDRWAVVTVILYTEPFMASPNIQTF